MLTKSQPVLARPAELDTYDLSPAEELPPTPAPRLVFATPKAPAQVPAAVEPPSLWPGVVLILGLGAGLFYFSYDRAFLIGEMTAGVCTPLAIYGLSRGGIRKTIMLFAFLGGFYGLTAIPDLLLPLLAPVAGASAPILTLAATAFAMFVLVLIAGIWSGRLRKRLHATPNGAFFDGTFGAAVGLAEGILVILTLCWVATLLRPQAIRLRDRANAPMDSFRHQFAGNLIRVADESSTGPLGDWVKATNPIEKIPALKTAIDGLNQTGQLSLQGLDPKLLESVQKFLNAGDAGANPEFNAILESYKQSMSARDHGYQQLPKP